MEDGFSQIGRMDPDRVKGRLRIQYVNEAGLPEAGIDGGGLFKDFMEELLRQGFSPQVGDRVGTELQYRKVTLAVASGHPWQ
jgi:ubiquitin-protein ligase E3 C